MLNPNHTQNVAQIVYFSHGGGPLPILGDHSHEAMVDFMRQLPSRLKKPDAILVISAHWEESTATLLGAQTPSMLYDYYGFPDEAYEMTYPAPGNPNLAHRIAGLLNQNGIPARVDPQQRQRSSIVRIKPAGAIIRTRNSIFSDLPFGLGPH